MSKLLLRYIHTFRDRHGRTRYYVRRRGFKLVPLPGLPGSAEFMDAYSKAIDPKTASRLEIGASKVQPGTMADLISRYYRSSDFLSLSSNTQRAYRGILERLRAEHGDKRVARLQREHVKAMMANKVGTPTAANALRKMLRLLMTLAIDVGMRTDDPTIGVKRIRIKTDGHAVWTAHDIETFRRHHPTGTRARLAVELALNTMQRRGDLVRMGRQHLQAGLLAIRQEKTGTIVEIPLLPELKAELDLLPAGQMTFLLNERGSAFRPASFTGWFHKMCTQAGLPDGRSVHGLRKSGATRLAEHGATDHEIMAWGGWATLAEVTRYTRAANRRKLAQGVVHKLERRTPSGNPK